MPRSDPLLVAAGAHRELILVPDGQIGRSCGMAVVPPFSARQMARPEAMRLISRLFLNYVNYFRFYRKIA
jgi:hypothetical protein